MTAPVRDEALLTQLIGQLKQDISELDYPLEPAHEACLVMLSTQLLESFQGGADKAELFEQLQLLEDFLDVCVLRQVTHG
ncbi:hypothetical protein [Vibrio spartinae]|uniref:Uncharacterized protein n=1 Tax=Vibrio spartinae TaxID=1918945 RepID=A0A1N6M3M7_9VIBR|nr:hypothetical protein [Vibrio spartinae]QMV14487.1 hypothetical protein Vspart_01743 [Vibrio spartinae]SIO93977.1 hypothetical protein VSP9026_01658 [Vibrio spartinae]